MLNILILVWRDQFDARPLSTITIILFIIESTLTKIKKIINLLTNGYEAKFNFITKKKKKNPLIKKWSFRIFSIQKETITAQTGVSFFSFFISISLYVFVTLSVYSLSASTILISKFCTFHLEIHDIQSSLISLMGKLRSATP